MRSDGIIIIIIIMWMASENLGMKKTFRRNVEASSLVVRISLTRSVLETQLNAH